MTARLELPSLLRLILENAVSLLQGQGGLIALREAPQTLQEEAQFIVRASYGIERHLLPFFTPLLTDIPIVKDKSRVSAWHIPGLHFRLRLIAAAAGVYLQQIVALPMVIEADFIGIIYIFRTTDIAFSANDRHILQSFADQAAIAVRNVKLYQQVTEERRLLATMLNDSADGVMIVDPQGKIQVFNKALEQMTGWSEEEALGRHCCDVLALRGRQGEIICDEACPLKLKNQKVEAKPYVEGDLKNKNRPEGSKPITVGITYSPIYNDDGELRMTIANVRDITRFREAEELQSTFISIISHELKTPVSLIKGYASTLMREDAQWDERTIRDSLQVIEEESDRLNELIDDLLQASRIQAGALKIKLAYFDLPRLASKIVDRFAASSEKHRLLLSFPPGYPPVLGDQEQIEIVLRNLVSNAIKYSPRGGNIWIGGWFNSERVYVYVADEGIGVPKGEEERIFSRFYRVDNTSTRRSQGVGLGLFICKAVVEMHGGQIWVESNEGSGSRFVFTLPQND